MTSIKIGELNHTIIAEIEINDVSFIRGGAMIGVSQDLLKYVPELEAIEVLIVTEDVFNQVGSMSFNNVSGLFSLASVRPTNSPANPVPTTNPQLPTGLFPTFF